MNRSVQPKPSGLSGSVVQIVHQRFNRHFGLKLLEKCFKDNHLLYLFYILYSFIVNASSFF